MPPENDANTTTNETTTNATPPAAGNPPADPKPEVQTQGNTGRAVMIPEKAMGRIKREEREKGQLKLAQELGFESVDAMKAHFAAQKAAPASTRLAANGARNSKPAPKPSQRREREEDEPPPAQSTAPQIQSRDKVVERLSREKAELAEKNARIAREKARAEKSAREARRELDAKEAEVQLKVTAVQCGIQDVDYALVLLQRHCGGKGAEELRTFDERKFFEGLRATHPLLFGEVVRPANTGVNGAEKEPGQKPGNNPPTPRVQTTGGNGPTDARRLTKEEFQKLMNQRGLQDPNGAPSY
jgi:hypothetical protein